MRRLISHSIQTLVGGWPGGQGSPATKSRDRLAPRRRALGDWVIVEQGRLRARHLPLRVSSPPVSLSLSESQSKEEVNMRWLKNGYVYLNC